MPSKPAKLSTEEKRERDARATYWMNQRKIERVAEAAARHGWHSISADGMLSAYNAGAMTEADDGRAYLTTENGVYRIEGIDGDGFRLRKIS